MNELYTAKTLLIVDNDRAFSEVAGQALSQYGFEVYIAHSQEEALQYAAEIEPEYCLLDLNLGSGSGLALLPQLLAMDSYTIIVVLTGYASISTAVEAIKLGATHYLAKPVTTDEIIEAFQKKEGNPFLPIESLASSLRDVEEALITQALERNQGNISATARELKMHRRTLQRKMAKIR